MDNHGRHIQSIVNRQPCQKHQADVGVPCYMFVGASDNLVIGICNKRARKAGATGTIQPESFRRKKAS